MLVSVIIPYYKDKKNILESVKSVIDQSYKNIEVIIIDDENSNSSKKILSKIKRKNKEIKILQTRKNRGVSFARNIGIDYARGKFVGFLDSDDLWKKNKIRKQVDFINLNKIDLCYTNY